MVKKLRACFHACQLNEWYGKDAGSLYRDALHEYLELQRVYSVNRTQEIMAAVVESMYGKTMGAPEIWKHEINLWKPEINRSAPTGRLSTRLRHYHSLYHKYLEAARMIWCTPNHELVFCHTAATYRSKGGGEVAIPPTFEGFEFVDTINPSDQDWCDAYNMAYAKLLEDSQTAPLPHRRPAHPVEESVKDARLKLCAMAGPDGAGVTSSGKMRPPCAPGEGARSMSHLKRRDLSLCVVHGHIPNAFGLFVVEADHIARLSLDTQYTQASVAVGLFLPRTWPTVSITRPPSLPDIATFLTLPEAIESTRGMGEAGGAFSLTAIVEGPFITDTVRMHLVRYQNGPAPRQYVVFVNADSNSNSVTAAQKLGARNVLGSVRLRCCTAHGVFEPVFGTSNVDVLEGALTPTAANNSHAFEVSADLQDGCVTVKYVTVDTELPRERGPTADLFSFEAHSEFSAGLDIEHPIVAGSDFEGDMHSFSVFNSVAKW